MKTTLFKRFGWFYLPSSPLGLIITAMALVFCGAVFVAVDRHSHSVSDTFYGVFPCVVCGFLILDWIARRSSGNRS